MTSELDTIRRDELKRKIDQNESFALVETLPAELYQSAHLPGAINLPPDKVRELAPSLLPDRHAEIVVYCARFTWHASEYAARELAAMGYANVRDYAEGKQGWMDAGLPVEGQQPEEIKKAG